MESQRHTIASDVRHRGPNLGAVGVVHTVLFLASLLVIPIMTKGGHVPTPFGAQGAAQAFFAEHGGAVRLAAFLQFGAAIPLGIFTATAVSRLLFLGVDVAGVFISLFGGLTAPLFLALSAVFEWVLGQPGVASQAEATRPLHLLAFATGGVGYLVPFGLLLAGVSVISWFMRLLPRWLVWAGLLLAAVAELSSLSMVFTPGAYLMPVARFLGLVWIMATGFLLPRSRSEMQKMRLRQAG
jgi:hypothetical protein